MTYITFHLSFSRVWRLISWWVPEVPSEEQGPARCPAVASPDKHYLGRIPGGDVLGSCQEVKDHLKCRICHCKQLVFLVRLPRALPQCLQHPTEPHQERGSANPASEETQHRGWKRCPQGLWCQPGQGCLGTIHISKKLGKAFLCVPEVHRLFSAQQSAALVVTLVDKISTDCRLSALDIFGFILGCPSINVTCASSW